MDAEIRQVESPKMPFESSVWSLVVLVWLILMRLERVHAFLADFFLSKLHHAIVNVNGMVWSGVIWSVVVTACGVVVMASV